MPSSPVRPMRLLAHRTGSSPKEIPARLGHSSITTTLHRYGHLMPSLGRQLAVNLNEVRKRGLAGPRKRKRLLQLLIQELIVNGRREILPKRRHARGLRKVRKKWAVLGSNQRPLRCKRK
jgi:hypothetical protein